MTRARHLTRFSLPVTAAVLASGCGYYTTRPLYTTASVPYSGPLSCICQAPVVNSCPSDEEPAPPTPAVPKDPLTDTTGTTSESAAAAPQTPAPATPVSSPECCPQYCGDYYGYCPRVYISYSTSYYSEPWGYDPWWPYWQRPHYPAGPDRPGSLYQFLNSNNHSGGLYNGIGNSHGGSSSGHSGSGSSGWGHHGSHGGHPSHSGHSGGGHSSGHFGGGSGHHSGGSGHSFHSSHSGGGFHSGGGRRR